MLLWIHNYDFINSPVVVILQLYDICDGLQLSIASVVGIAQLSLPIINAHTAPPIIPIATGISNAIIPMLPLKYHIKSNTNNKNKNNSIPQLSDK